jgi:hypothetical protein
VVVIDASVDLSILEESRRAADRSAAEKAMRSLLNDREWETPQCWVWHHRGVLVEKKTIKYQMILIPKTIHENAVHKGAFAYLTEYLTAKKALSEAKAAGTVAEAAAAAGEMRNANKTLKALGFIGRTLRNGFVVVGAAATIYSAANAYADEGVTGAGKEVMRDMVFANEVEYLYSSAAEGAYDYLGMKGMEDYNYYQRFPEWAREGNHMVSPSESWKRQQNQNTCPSK